MINKNFAIAIVGIWLGAGIGSFFGGWLCFLMAFFGTLAVCMVAEQKNL